MSNIIQIVRHRYLAILLAGVIVAGLAAGATLFFPLQYRADAQVLIIPKSRLGVDPYTVVKSAERVGDNLVQILQTDDFLNKVRANAGAELDWAKFDKLNDRQKRKAWPKMVAAGVVYGTGVVNVSAYHTNADEAKKIARVVVNTLETVGWEYVGADVIIKGVNNPVATRWPARPNLAVNAVLGFLAGAMLMALVLVKKSVISNS
ncbi:MAG: Wzz/FepE/Etk N-terminal domain-containing protein [Patescibacteria group bacterium]